MDKYFFNNNENLYFFSEIKRKIDGLNVATFTDEEISKCRMMRDLIANGVLREVTEDQYLAFIVAKKQMLNPNVQQPQQKTSTNPMDLKPDPYGLNKNVVTNISSKLVADRVMNTQSDLSLDPREVTSINYGMKKTAQVETKAPVADSFDFNNISSFESSVVQKVSKPTKEIWWCGPAGDAGGYGKMNRECINGLHKKGFKIQLFQPDNLIPDSRCLVRSTPAMEEMLRTKVGDNVPSIWGIMPPQMLVRQGRKILFTMTETSEVPKSFAAKCNNAEELWLPSKFCVESFERAKERGDIKKSLNIQHMPLGVDTGLYRPFKLSEEDKASLGIKTRGFVFLSLFGWSLRKGSDVLLNAYLSEFKADEDVTLLIVSRKNGSSSTDNNQSIRDDIKKCIARVCPEGHPHIVHFGESVQEEVLPMLYNMSDCFVLPSRGEGFGLPFCEAGATEKPVIATRCGGQMDFLTDDNSYLVDIEGYDVACQEIKCISSYYDEPFAVLGDKTLQQTKEAMRFVFNNQSQASEKGKNLRRDLVNNFTWNHLVDRIEKRLS